MAQQWLPIADLAAGVQSQKLKAVDLVEQALSAIAEQQDYQAIIATTEERARQRAQQIDADSAVGKPSGRLAGVPFIARG